MDLSFQTPNVSRRSAVRIMPKVLEFVSQDDEEDLVYGRPKETLRSFFESIIVNSNFLTNEKVTRALNTGFLMEFTGNEADYGPLAALVNQTVQQLADRVGQSNTSTATDGDKILLWMLTNKDKSDKAHQRSHLCELLLYLAETASQHHSHDNFLLYNKDLTLFLLKNVLMSTRNESPTKYERLFVETLELSAPEASRYHEPDLYRTHLKMTILEHILGDKSMESVISLYDSKVKAFSTGWTPAEYRTNKKILPKKAQTPRMEARWATDDFGFGDRTVTDLNQDVAYFTGQPLIIKNKKTHASNRTGMIKAHPPFGGTSTATQDTTALTLDDSDRAKVISFFRRMEACAQNKGQATWNDINDMFDFFVDPRCKAVVMGETTLVPASPFRPVSPPPFTERDLSPLTVESVEFEHQEGITVTEEGLRHSIQCLYAMRHDPECKHLQYLENDQLVPPSWRSDQLADDVDPNVGGQKWTLENFEIMGIIDGGNFGRLLELRCGSFRICGKIEFFSLQEYPCFCGELLQSTKVKQRNITRVLGYFAIPFLGDRHKPICMCILQEKGLHNLRKIIVKLNESSMEGLTPAEKLGKACSVLDHVLSALEELEEADILHRDIKPENIVLFSDGLWKLVDFGLARVYDSNGTLTEDAGTGKYIPPEGKGPKHDCFSVGIVMYELMCGECPSEKVPSDKELAEAFKIEGNNVAAQQALEVCKGLTLSSTEDRWTAKIALAAIRTVMESLSN